MRSRLFILLLALFSLGLTPQTGTAQIPVGSFRAHLSYYGTHSIATTPDYVYAAADNGIVIYDRSDGSTDTWTKVDGLSETGIDMLFYDAGSENLVVVYDNTNLDFIHDGKLTNLPDIKNKQMTGNKSVNSILAHDGKLYLACSFGIVIIDPKTLLVLDTWYTHIASVYNNVSSIQIFENKYYIFTSDGIYHTPVTSNSVADFSTWQKENTLPTGEYTESCIFNGRLYACLHLSDEPEKDSLLYYNGGIWQASDIDLNPVRALDVSGDTLMVATWNFAQIYDANEQMIGYYNYEAYFSWPNVQDGCLNGNTVWLADDNNGLVEIALDWSVNRTHILDGPYSTSAFKMNYAGGVMALAPGALTSTWGHGYLHPDFSYFTNEQWHNVLQVGNPILSGMYDLASVAVNPRNPAEIYGGIFEGGLVKYTDDQIVALYNRFNSPLHSYDSSEAFISSLRFDGNGNLWIGTGNSSLPLSVLKTDGTWATFPLSSYINGYTTQVGDILIDSRGYKWVILPRANTIVVVDDNRTIDNHSDDRLISINMNAAANIETSAVNCAVEDKSGQIWIGCNLGIKVIYNPSQVFNGTAYPQNVLIEQINYVQNLFEFEEVTCIEVDDGNRKWVGTAKSGVFLISSNGDEELLHFTTENSPLPSNRINDIEIQRESGEVFFATANGLVSYRGTATEGKEDYSEVKVFPNPVRESYHGIITVSGLMDNSFCKVVDAAGNLVWQDYANGGTFTWDGKDFYGKRPDTGVYFVFASSSNGKKKNVARLLFVH
ncbi:MAG: hypothetical protein II757_05385 [Bacteroidales bacterium]|nr:hypothetical protein [Bacteroidales bacterium]